MLQYFVTRYQPFIIEDDLTGFPKGVVVGGGGRGGIIAAGDNLECLMAADIHVPGNIPLSCRSVIAYIPKTNNGFTLIT